MTSPDSLRIVAATVGILLGYGGGRWLWIRRRLAVSFWTVIVGLILIGLLTERVFDSLGLASLWQAAFFPLLVGLGVGIAVTTARPPRTSAWWELWKE
ncbi:MAG: hypothetical protein ACRDIY_01325 [Chloroflexota bacterium]